MAAAVSLESVSFQRPLKSVISTIETVSQGNLDATISEDLIKRKDEVGILAQSINRLIMRYHTMLNDLQKVSTELKNNSELAERFSFLKEFQTGVTNELEFGIDHDKKIIPDFFTNGSKINDNKRNKLISSNIYISAIFIIIVLSGVFFMYLPEKLRSDSLDMAYNKKADSLLIEINKRNKVISESNNEIKDKKIIEEYQNKFLSKNEELENIKTELAHAKQELYKNGNIASVGNINNITVSLIKNIELKWECDKKVSIRVFNINGKPLSVSDDFVFNNYSFARPENGFYYIHFIPEGRSMIVKLLEINDNNLALWQM